MGSGMTASSLSPCITAIPPSAAMTMQLSLRPDGWGIGWSPISTTCPEVGACTGALT